MRRIHSIAFILLLQLPLLASAQSFYALRKERDLIVSVGSGATKFYGDLVNPGQIGKVRMNVNVGAEYYFTNRISARAEVTWFQLSGDDALANTDRRERNLSFFSNNIELDFTGAIQLIPNGKKFYQRAGFNIYGWGGVGVLYFNPKTTYEGEVVKLQPLQTEGVKYRRTQFVLPVGLGVKIKVNPWMNVAIEGGYRETFTDYLDDVSVRRYPDPANLIGGVGGLSAKLSDRRVEIGTQPSDPQNVGVRGNPDNQDAYFILNVKAQFYMPTTLNLQRKLFTAKRKAYYKKPGKGGMFKIKRNAAKTRRR
jgi:Outer membrane protein beta-barrel domain